MQVTKSIKFLLTFQVEAIDNVGFGQLAKIYLYWKDPWWAAGEGGIQLAWPSDINGFSRYDHCFNSLSYNLITCVQQPPLGPSN